MTADDFAAIEQARGLLLRPAQVAVMRARPFPSGMRRLLRVAAGDESALEEAARRTGDTASGLREASVFYVQQVMLDDASDSYRILGVEPDAPVAEIKAHYGLLMRWMHPDRNPDAWDVVFAERVTRAWNDLRTSDRRNSFDNARLAPDIVENEDWTGRAAPFRPPPVRVKSPVDSVPIAHSDVSVHSTRGNVTPVRYTAGAAFAAVAALVLFVVWPTLDEEAPAPNPVIPQTAIAAGAASAFVAAAKEDRATGMGSSDEDTADSKPPSVSSIAADSADFGASKPGRIAVAPLQPKVVPSEPETSAASARVATTAVPSRVLRTPASDFSRIDPVSPPARAVAFRAPANATTEIPQGPDQIAAVEAAVEVDLPGSSIELMSASDPTESLAMRADVPDLDQASLLIGRFARAYQRGDIDAMAALFAQDARSQGGGMAQIRAAYDRLFEQTSHRSISIRDIQWRIEDERAHAVGRFEISQARDKGSKAQVSRGTIRFDIEQRQDQLLIARLEHTDRGF